MGSDFGIFEGLDSSVLVDEPGFGSDLISVFLDLGLVRLIFGRTGLKFGLFGGGLNGFKVWFWWANMSLNFDLSSSKQFKVRYTISVQSNTNQILRN